MLATAFNDKTIRWAVIGFAILAAAGWLLPAWILNNVMFGLARGLAVLGLLVLWRTGLVSFGHALYFGLGAYAVALLEKYAKHGVEQFAFPDVLEVPPISEYGNVVEISDYFGGPEKLLGAVTRLQALLYAA